MVIHAKNLFIIYVKKKSKILRKYKDVPIVQSIGCGLVAVQVIWKCFCLSNYGIQVTGSVGDAGVYEAEEILWATLKRKWQPLGRPSASIEFAHHNPQIVGKGTEESNHDTLKTVQIKMDNLT